MIRGTTPTHTFQLPFDTSEVCSVRLIYKQELLHGCIVLTKEIDDCQMSGDQISVTLTQEDTLSLNCKYPVKIQLRVLTKQGESLATTPITRSLVECLDGEVLV